MAEYRISEKPKKSLEFRMCKKVAELTQVVHMLFTRNHEKEVEIEALKEAYEYEIQLVIDDAKKKIRDVEARLEEMEKEQSAESDRMRSLYVQEFSIREEESKKKLSSAEKQVYEERKECQNLRDLLIVAQKDIEKLRQGVTEQMSNQSDEISKKEKELDKLRRQVAQNEKVIKDQGKESSDTIKELKRSNERLEKELNDLQAMLEDTHKSKEALLTKNRVLETDLKNLRKDFSKKVSEVVSSHQSSNSQQTPDSTPKYAIGDYNEEIERLRREVERYRLELSNRDCNFNRMFTEKTPMLIDSKAGKIGIQQIQVMSHSATRSPCMTPATTLSRERTASSVCSSIHDDQRSILSARKKSLPNGHGYLPTLSKDQKAKFSRLNKPRPLPKEVLFGN